MAPSEWRMQRVGRLTLANAGLIAAAPNSTDNPERLRLFGRTDPPPSRHLVAKPRRLPLGIAPRLHLRVARSRPPARCAPARWSPKFPDADRLHGRKRRIEAEREQRRDLLERAFCRPSRQSAGRSAHRARRAPARARSVGASSGAISGGIDRLRPGMAQRLAGRLDHLKRPQYPGAVMRLEQAPHRPDRAPPARMQRRRRPSASARASTPAADLAGRSVGTAARPSVSALK